MAGVAEDRARRPCLRHLRRGETCGSSSRGDFLSGAGPACHPSFPCHPRSGSLRPRRADWPRDERTGPGPRGPRPQRPPRDALGRPLPYDAVGEERAPEGVVRTPDASLAEAQALLDAGRPFHAHEVLEDAWKSAPDHERELWRGLAQLAVGLTHAMRGNARGAATLLDRGAGNIAPCAAAPPHGIDVPGLVGWARRLAAEPQPAPSAPRLRAAGTHPAPGGDSPA